MTGETDPHQPEIDAHLRALSQAMGDEQMRDLEGDLLNIQYQRQVLDALVLEGVDIGFLASCLEDHPDPGLQQTADDFWRLINEFQADLTASSNTRTWAIRFFGEQHNLAKGIQRVGWARFNIDDGADADEAKIATQLEVYTDKALTAEEKAVWLRVLDRIIPEHPGLDPSDPQTAAEIEEWLA